MKRTTVSDVDLGTITAVYNNPELYPEQRANKEIWRLNGENMTDIQLHSTPIHKI